MGKYSVRYLPAAERDVDEIVDYLMAENPNAVITFLDGMDAAERQLSEFPDSGSKPRLRRFSEKGYRFVTVCGYLVFYIVRDDVVWYMRVLYVGLGMCICPTSAG